MVAEPEKESAARYDLSHAEVECRRRLERLGVPRRYQTARLADFADCDVVFADPLGEDETIAQRLQEPRDLLVVGKVGRGKTRLACALAGIWGATYRSVVQIVFDVRTGYGRNTTEELIRWLLSTPILILDDLTAARRNEATAELLLLLLDQRLAEMRPTVVTTNASHDAIAAWDASIASRLSSYEVVGVTGPDRRTTKEG